MKQESRAMAAGVALLAGFVAMVAAVCPAAGVEPRASGESWILDSNNWQQAQG